ncbi:MAG: hypothetical protein DMG76_25555 [Acidobacteria bacterium]|nr:MAG: hypothetical protein DMG76_25555 [Acidobacteriota bacterium]
MGIQIVAIDMNGDGKPDILTSARKVHLFSSFSSITSIKTLIAAVLIGLRPLPREEQYENAIGDLPS